MKEKLELNNVSHYYKKVLALDDISLAFEPGIYGLIGPNGAGKSTLIRLITGLLKNNMGHIKFNGQDISGLKDAYRNLIGLMPQNQKGYEQFTGYSFLHYMTVLKGIPKSETNDVVDKLVKQVSLQDSIHRKIKTYSGGMRQRLMFAQSIIGNPKILILDEPTAGLDPFERIKLRNYISEISHDKIVILATHVMQDVESIADSLILLDKGKLVFEGTGESLLESLSKKVFEKTVDSLEVLQEYQEKYRVSRVYKFDQKYRIRYLDPTRNDGTLQPNFEDAYLYYVVQHENT